MPATQVWLTCADCKQRYTELWDGRCTGCFYVYSGGDLGQDDWWNTHAVVRDGGIYWETK